MPAKINHLAIVSEKYAIAGKFYEAMFGMRTSPNARPARAVTVGDGYVGLNINPRFIGRPARFDHFGVEVDDAESTFDHIGRTYPTVKWLKRPTNRPFAGVTTHDPDGNVFDISQKAMENRTDIYADNNALNERHVRHFGFRTLNPDAMANFYADVFKFRRVDAASGDPNRYLTDGHITMVVMPWAITDYDGTGIVSPSMDHIGFQVENLETFKTDVARVGGSNPYLAPSLLQGGPEDRARMELARRSCPLCEHYLVDVDGVLISASESA
jgi:predicted enzyme related to lactoylglutathione lyase